MHSKRRIWYLSKQRRLVHMVSQVPMLYGDSLKEGWNDWLCSTQPLPSIAIDNPNRCLRWPISRSWHACVLEHLACALVVVHMTGQHHVDLSAWGLVSLLQTVLAMMTCISLYLVATALYMPWVLWTNLNTSSILALNAQWHKHCFLCLNSNLWCHKTPAIPLPHCLIRMQLLSRQTIEQKQCLTRCVWTQLHGRYDILPCCIAWSTVRNPRSHSSAFTQCGRHSCNFKQSCHHQTLGLRCLFLAPTTLMLCFAASSLTHMHHGCHFLMWAYHISL